MEVDEVATEKEATPTVKAIAPPKEILPEADVYLRLLVVLWLMDEKKLNEVSREPRWLPTKAALTRFSFRRRKI